MSELRINNAERAFGLLTAGVRLRLQPSPQASPLVLEFDSSTRTGDCLPQLEFNSSVPASSKLRRAAGSGQPELGSGFRPLKTQNSKLSFACSLFPIPRSLFPPVISDYRANY
jgi:hypothetical protein